MKIKIIALLLIVTATAFAQDTVKEPVFKKRVLETTEVDFLASYYTQDGSRSAVSGGLGSEKLTDVASNIVVAMPLNDDDLLTIDLGISAYSSASSSNINPYDTTNGTPWQASSGASQSDQLTSIVANYSHSSDSRDLIWNTDVSFSNEYDYTSVGVGGGVARLFNAKNTELSVKVNAYLDQWRPIYPKELADFDSNGTGFLNQGIFNGRTIWDQNGQASTAYSPSAFKPVSAVNRNSFSASFGFSQVLTKKLQVSFFFDVLQQQGLLSSPYHRMYFADKANFYVGQPQFIANYTNENNKGACQLADDIERLPDTRFKLPIGARLNYYLNERVALRTYYRYYSDNWDIQSHTASIEVPVKLTDKFTVFPMYRFYTQTQSKYYTPYETHLSTEKFYTSDADLATFDANQYGFGVNYTDIFTAAKVWKFGLKNIDFRFNHYKRSDNLTADIATVAFKFIMQ
ncbi:DUF3570 domain-containing protein [Flavobacterium sp. GNP001]